MNTAAQTECPPPDLLAQLVSGSLIESAAERLFRHLDECQTCQDQVDRLSTESDEVIAAVRRAAVPPPPGEDAGLSRLISDAQRLSNTDDTQQTGRSSTQTVSAADFIDGLRRSGLMPGEELNQLLSELSWNGSDRDHDSSTLAKALIENRKLTPFQAKLLLRGRWKGLVLGNYAILHRLGQGGMGSVFKARHTRMGRIVCLKVVNSAGRQSQAVIDRFRNEARALAALSHPNIVVAHDADEAKGIPYLVMEYIDGDDLAKHVRAHQPLSAKDALEVGIQTAEALHYAHHQGVIHRDVKPHNIVATRDPKTGQLSVKVLDLGLARFDTLITDNPDASVLAAMTNTGVVIGTVDYMSPEQALDSRNADARSDIYSLGCTLFFLLTGHPPFPGETVMQRLVAHREQPAPELWQRAGVSIDIEMVVHKMLAKQPENRYQSMQEVLEDLRLLQSGQIPKAAIEAAETKKMAMPLPAATAAIAAQPISPDQPTAQFTIEPSPADTDFETSSFAERKRPRRRRHAKLFAGNGATALALLGIAAAAVMAAPIWNLIAPRIGGDRAIRNGGDGRALIIVGSENFREDQFQMLAGRLTAQDIDIVAASANYGTEKKDFGGQLKAAYDNINLAYARPTEFDAIFVIGGSYTDLIHKDKQAHSQMIRVIKGALENDVALTGCCEGWEAIYATNLLKKGEYKDKPKFKTHSADELASKAELIFNQLARQK